VNTEIADMKDSKAAGWVCFDAECPRCRRWAGRFGTLLKRHGFEVVPLQSETVRAALKLSESELRLEMRVITRDGKVFGGAEALLCLCRSIPSGRMLYALSRVPGATPLLGMAYDWIARNRTCDGAACDVRGTGQSSHRDGRDAIPLIVLTGAAVFFGAQLPAWLWMWTLCFALFFG
jgi:predicted DCC family thiol-disulfide oxidoreductase YuxK